MADGKPYSKRTLLDKWRLVRAAARDNKRLSSGDVAVLIALCDRYGSQHRPDEPPMAGHALLGAMSGMSRRATIDSTRRLIDAGYIEVLALGAGTRGTRYTLNFARGEADFTTKKSDPSGEVDFTTVVNCTSPLQPASGEAYFTESPLTEAPLQGALTEREIDHRPPSAPDAAGLAPASPGTAVEELQPSFESLWRAYGHNRAKKEARVAWNALPPEVNRQAVIEAAKAWQESWAAQGKPDAPRFTLARWLKDERYDEDAPRGFNKVERPAKAKASRPEPNPPRVRKPRRRLGPTRIATTDVVTSGNVTELRFTTDTADEHVIVLEHPNAQRQEAGQRQLAALVNAAGLNQVEDGSDLHGRTVVITADSFIAPATRPDDEPPWPRAPEPEPRSVPTESAAAIAERMARRFDEPWPEWMSDDAA